jgi:hypothetical protein
MEKINAMIKDINKKDFVNAEVKFQSVMNDKVAHALANAKETFAKNLFNNEEQTAKEK